MNVSAEDDSTLLVVLLEVHTAFFASLNSADEARGSFTGIDCASFFQQVLLFLNAYCLLNEGNKLAVFAVQATHRLPCKHAAQLRGCRMQRSRVVYVSPVLQTEPGAVARARKPEPASAVILANLRTIVSQLTADEGPPLLAGALSRALCFVNRVTRRSAGASAQRGRATPRLLCLLGAPDAPDQYIPVMNAIFAAQRAGVVVDACVAGRADSGFLQQAAHLTGGTYLRPPRLAAIAQYLLTAFSGDPGARSYLDVPRPVGVDFRASCFCHKKPIDLGYVCSVCLSIFCEGLDECSTCGTTFIKSTGKRAAGPDSTAGPSKMLHS